MIRKTRFQAIPVSVVPSALGSPIGDVSTEMVVISKADFDTIEDLLEASWNRASTWSGGIVGITPDGYGFTVQEAAEVVQEAETLRERLAEVMEDPDR